MSTVTSTRRLAVVCGAGGVVFGGFMAGMVLTQFGEPPVWLAVVMGLIAAIFFGGMLFLVFYFGFVRPRQLDPGPAGFADRRVSGSERIWGDGRPLPAWLRRFMYATAPLFLVVAVLNVGLMVASGTMRASQLGASLVLTAFAVLSVVTARRGARPRPPYSTWVADQS